MTDSVEAGVALTDQLLMTELWTLAMDGVIEIDPLTELPEGVPAEMVGTFGAMWVRCASREHTAIDA